MPICCDCRIDQPDEAFSEESQPLCESCYQGELEEEAAGGEVGNDAAVDGDDDDDQESAINALETGAVDRVGVANYHSDDENDEESNHNNNNNNNNKPRKIIPFASAARLLNPQGELLDRDEPPDGESGPPDVALLEPLVEAVYERGYSNGLGLDSRQVLHYRLKRVLFTPHDDDEDDYDPSNDVLSWLTRPLVYALLEGPQASYHHRRVAPLNVKETVIEPQTLLHWLCQWKLLLLQCGWKGHDDMVDLLIRAGASVDATLTNGCTPLFFAVKYGSVDTVRILHQAGANLSHRDCRKQTCLRNALPQASPYILKYLLQNGVSVDETFWAEAVDKSSPKTRINALDILVTEFVAPNPDVSWVTLGMASIDDYALCMILLLQKGLQISPNYYDVTYFLSHYLQGSINAPKRLYYTRHIADLMLGQWLPIAAKEELGIVATTSRDDMDEATTNENSAPLGASSGCHLCHNNTASSSSSFPPVTLFCRHQFCRDCILQYTKATLLDLSEASTNTSGNFQSRQRVIGCPACQHPLGKDLMQQTPSGPHPDAGFSPNPAVDKTRKRNLLEQRRLGLSKLAIEQLQFECEARNLVVAKKELKEHCVESIVHDWQDFTVPQDVPNDDDDDDDDDETEMDDSSGSRLMAELTLSNTMISEDNYLWVAPSSGSVMIPINVKGVPIFALLSTTAPYTVVSPRFVQTFEFELNTNLQMTSSNPLKFVRAEDDEQKMNHNYDRPVNNNPDEAPPRPKPKVITAPSVHLTAVKDFSFTLGKSGIQVDLPSAVQACEPHTHSWPVGVILGRDFVQSAAWMQVSVEVDLEVCLGRTVALLTCNNTNAETEVEPRLEFDLIAPSRASHVEEDLRYYSHDGKLFWTPLWHIRLSEHDSCISIGQYLKELLPLPGKQNTTDMPKATQCYWCCREFPSVVTSKTRGFRDWIMSRPLDSGMLQCPLCCKDGNSNESSKGNQTSTYYCDVECQQQAQYVHSLRKHNGMDLTNYCGGKRELKPSFRFKAVVILMSVLLLILGILAQQGRNAVNDSTGVASNTMHIDNIELSDVTDEQPKTDQEDEL